MDSKVKGYYRVKPEFDQYTLYFKFSDKRFKHNYRIEGRTLIAGELFTIEQYKIMLKSCQYDISDMFVKVKCKSFMSFGCRFDQSYEFDNSLVDLMCDRRKELLKQFISIYQEYCKIVEGTHMHMSQKVYCSYLSIETLAFLITYYSDLINLKRFY